MISQNFAPQYTMLAQMYPNPVAVFPFGVTPIMHPSESKPPFSRCSD